MAREGRLTTDRSIGLSRAVLVLVAAALILAAPATAAIPMQLPFPVGESWQANGPHPFNGTSGERNSVDLGRTGGATGTVVAAAAGTVSLVRNCGGGLEIRIAHADGWQTGYYHLSAATVVQGAAVAMGQVIGATGDGCGAATFKHVHFSLRRNGADHPIGGLDIGGHTVHAKGYSYGGFWTRNSDGVRVTEDVNGDARCCVTSLAVSSGPVPPTANGGQAIQHANGGRCLDVPAATPAAGTQVQLYDCISTSAAQRWLHTAASELRVYGSPERCLDVRGGQLVSGTPVQIWDCNGGRAQRWAVNADGTITIAGLCLDASGAGTANGTPVQVYTCNGGVAQQWGGPAVANGGQAVQHANGGRCLDVPAAVTLRGTQVQLYDCISTSAAQRWLHTAASELRVYPNRCLDVRGGQLVSGTPVQIWDCNGGRAQRWAVNADGTITIAGLCLDASGAGTANGTPVQVYTCNGGVAQQWGGPAVANGGQAVQHANGGRCLDVPAAVTLRGTQVQLYDCISTSAAQRWVYTGASELRVYPNRCLDVRGGQLVSGTPVQIWDCNGGRAQQWTLNPDGTITIAGLCLDASGAGTANGTPLQVYTCNGGAAQRWSWPVPEVSAPGGAPQVDPPPAAPVTVAARRPFAFERLTVRRTVSRPVLRRSGLSVRVRGVAAGTRVSVVARLVRPSGGRRPVVIAGREVRVARGGALTVKLRLRASAAAALRAASRGAKVVVRVKGSGHGARAVTKTATVRLTR